LSVTDTNAVPTGYAYDPLNRGNGEASADIGAQGFVRNAAGDVVSVTDPRGITLGVIRDVVGRVISVTPPSGTALSFSYVAGRSDGKLAQMTDPSGATTWTYDSVGRMLTKQQTVAGTTRTVTVTRDTLGRPTAIVYPSGMRVDATYSGDVVAALSINGTAVIDTITYRPFSQMASSWRWGNNSVYSRSFDADGRITSVTLGSKLRSYTYDALGRVSGFTDAGSQGTQASSFGYDETGQLISYTGPQGSASYGYDGNGNRRTLTQFGYSGTYAYFAGTNRISQSYNRAYQYNVDGNPSTDASFNFSYNSFGRSTLASNAAEKLSRTFNAQGMRVSTTKQFYFEGGTPAIVTPPISTVISKNSSKALTKSESATLTPPVTTAVATPKPAWITTGMRHFIHDDQGNLLGEYERNNGYSQETVWFNGQPVATVIGGAIYYISADHLATPRAIVRASNNVEVWRWDSDPFGNTSPTLPSPLPADAITYNLRFPGQYYEATTGYHYNWMRDYDPQTGRYLQADPIGLKGGLSRYSYVGASPLNGIDPLGLAGISITFGGDLTIGRGGTAGSGGYFTFDTLTSGALTYTGSTYGLSTGLGLSFTLFSGQGTSLLEGLSTGYNVSVGPLTFALTFSSNFNDGFLGITAISAGVAAGLPLGATASTTNTIIQTGGVIIQPPVLSCRR
jgi:RHS repeat-associated protein